MNDEKDKDKDPIPVMPNYRCRRCGALFVFGFRLGIDAKMYHHCKDKGIGIGKLVGSHEI